MDVEREAVIGILPRDEGGHDVRLIVVGIDRLLREEGAVDGDDIVVLRIISDELAVDDRHIRPVVGDVVFEVLIMRLAHVGLVVDVDLPFIRLVETGDHAVEHGEIGARDRRPEGKGDRTGRTRSVFAVGVASAAACRDAERHGARHHDGKQAFQKFLFHNDLFDVIFLRRQPAGKRRRTPAPREGGVPSVYDGHRQAASARDIAFGMREIPLQSSLSTRRERRLVLPYISYSCVS